MNFAQTALDAQNRLSEPFPASDIEWRVQRSGAKNGKPWAMVAPYITSRAVQERLDDVFGVFGWENNFKDLPNGGIECTLKVKNPEGENWISKSDAAPATNVEPVKGGRSDAMKRAAVHLGIGRYLYKLDAQFADCFPTKGAGHNATFKGKNGDADIHGSWRAPTLDSEYLPSTTPSASVGNVSPNDASVQPEPAPSDEPESQVVYYPDDAFKKNFPQWRDMIASGAKEARVIIGTIETKAPLTDAQRNALNAVKVTNS